MQRTSTHPGAACAEPAPSRIRPRATVRYVQQGRTVPDPAQRSPDATSAASNIQDAVTWPAIGDTVVTCRALHRARRTGSSTALRRHHQRGVLNKPMTLAQRVGNPPTSSSTDRAPTGHRVSYHKPFGNPFVFQGLTPLQFLDQAFARSFPRSRNWPKHRRQLRHQPTALSAAALQRLWVQIPESVLVVPPTA